MPNGNFNAWINGPTSTIGGSGTATAAMVYVGVEGGSGSLVVNGILNAGGAIGRGGDGNIRVDGGIWNATSITLGSYFNNDNPDGAGALAVQNGGRVVLSGGGSIILASAKEGSGAF